MTFAYMLKKIEQQNFETTPFRHLEIFDFFEEKHFEEIIAAPEVDLRQPKNDGALIDDLGANGYRSIEFPGTTRDVKAYLKWHAGHARHQNLVTCDGFGITFRLFSFKNTLLRELNEFFNSYEFMNCVAEKFEIELGETYADNGLQKYLDGYEISPHPDLRKKALTYMINVNPGLNSEKENFHTHYLSFLEPFKYVQEYWTYNQKDDRCWVPWDWCQTIKQQTKNNSFVMFSPSNDTMHGVRAKYNHLKSQRTQFYGNLWYNKNPATTKPNWHDFVISATPERYNYVPLKRRIRDKIISIVPFKARLRKVRQFLQN